MNENIKGRINSLETFGTVDGPGIRFIVFMQGCPLRCLYCHNRDSWDVKSGREVTVGEIFEEVLKYSDYFRFSGGGLTVSGGEPTLQAPFVTELFRRCREAGIHTALDSSGFADLDRLGDLLDYTDMVLLDIKQMDEMKHRGLTGVGREKIDRFAAELLQRQIPVWIRYVLVPGYTDDAEDLLNASRFIADHPNIEKVEVLPYHSLGQHKWEEVGAAYQLGHVETPDSEAVERAQRILSMGLKKQATA